MKSRIPPALFLLYCTYLSGADPKWIRMKSDHFEMYSTAGERATRDTIKSFEQVRDFFNQLISVAEEHPIPVRLVAFNSAKEYEPYKFNEVAVAYFMPGADRDTIVMSHTGIEAHPMAVHEYTHLVMEHGHLNAPPWLNEGIAEVFSTMRPNGGKIMIGEIIKGRLYEMLNTKWTPLMNILNADHDSPYYNEKNKAGSLYNEGWALTHMLMFDKRYSAKFDVFLRAVSAGTPSADALAENFGVPVSEIEKELQQYIHGNSFYARVYSTKLEKITDELPAEPAPEFEVKLVLTELLARPGKEAATRKSLDELMKEEPKRPEPYAELGYVEWRQGNARLAQEQFEKAFSLGDRSRRMLWDLGRMSTYENPKQAIEALTELKTQEPQRGDVRVQLAMAMVRNKQPGGAVVALNEMAEAKLLTRAEAPRFFITAAYAYLDLKDTEKAKSNLKRAGEFIKEDRDKEEARNLSDYIARIEQRGVRASAGPPNSFSASSDLPARPTLVRPPSSVVNDAPKVEIFPDKPSLEGTFAELVCSDEARIVLKTAAGNKSFVIEDPQKIVVMGKDGGKADLHCGAQQPVPMKIEFEPAPAGSSFDGFVRVLYFL